MRASAFVWKRRRASGSHSRVARRSRTRRCRSVARRSHGGPHAGFLAPKAELHRRVLRALVRVIDDAFWSTLPERHVERGDYELGLEALGDRSTDDSPAK